MCLVQIRQDFRKKSRLGLLNFKNNQSSDKSLDRKIGYFAKVPVDFSNPGYLQSYPE